MKFVLAFWLFLVLPFCSKSQIDIFKADTIYYISTNPVSSGMFTPLLIDLNNSCNSESETTIDLYTHNVPDAFLITTLDTTPILQTPFFGASCPMPNFNCFSGYIYIEESNFSFPPLIPNNHAFQSLDFKSLGRINFISSEQKLLFWILPNPLVYTNFAFYIHPTIYTYSAPPVEVFIGSYACDSLNLYEFSTPNSSFPCDTIFIDGIRYTNEQIGDIFDTIYHASNTWLEYTFHQSNETFYITSDTTIERTGINAHGCEYSEFLTVIAYFPTKVYIPNAFSPNNDGINDYFEAYTETPIEKQRIQIFSRYGGEIYDSSLFSWNGGDYPPDVYVYLITLTFHGKDYIFSGDVTLLR